MCDDGEPPAKKCKYSLRSYSRNDVQKFNKINTTQLLDLKDQCLDQIFGHLNVIDLCSVTRVSKRFQQLAEMHVKEKFSEFDFSILSVDRLISSQEASDILCTFGHMITSVTVPKKAFHNHEIAGHVEQGLLKDLVECCGRKLHTVTLKNFHFTPHAVDTLNKLSESLQSLALVGCVLAVDCVFHLSNFSSLKRLTITNTRYPFTDVFPALKYLRLDKVSIPTKLERFIVTHKQLKKLVISQCTGISSVVFRFIGKNLEKLKTLELVRNVINKSESIKQIQSNVQHLGELKHLQRFTWHYDFLSIGNILAKIVLNKTPMKVLRFRNGLVDNETINAIKKMKNLKSLEFNRVKGLKNRHVIEIAAEVTQLKKCCIGWQHNLTTGVLKKILPHTKQLRELRIRSKKFRLDPTLYTDILNIVKERVNGIKFTITIDSDNTDILDLIPQQTINLNKNWLMIERGRFR